jgi:exonuclease SbcC
MYNTRIAVQGIMGFKDIDLDLTKVSGDMIAIVGDNGEGKTTLLESIGHAGLYRKLPSREQGLYKYCTGKEAKIESEFQFGEDSYKTQILISPSGAKMEAYIFENGKALNDGKVGTFDDIVSKKFGSSELVLSSVFATQNKNGSFLELPKAKRKELFMSMLNLGMLQTISLYCGEMANKLRAEEDSVLIKFKSIEPACNVAIPDRASLTSEKDSLEQDIILLEQDRDLLKLALMKENTKSESRKQVEEQRKSIIKQISDLESRMFDARKKVASLESSTQNIKVLTSEESIKLELEADSLNILELRKQQKELEIKESEDSNHRVIIKLMEIRNKINSAEADIKNTTSKLDKCKSDSARLELVPCGGDGEYSTCPLISSSVSQKNSIPSIENEIATLRIKINDLKAEEKSSEIQPIDLSIIKMELKDILIKISKAKAASETLNNISLDRAKIESIKEKIEEANINIGYISLDLQIKNDELNGLPEPIISIADSLSFKLIKDIAVKESDIKNKKQSLHDTIMELGKIDVIKKNVESAAKIAGQLRDDIEKIRVNKGQWLHLSDAFGPKSIQAIEIDSAGPWISNIINDLLRSCFGARFSINLITQMPKADKTGMKDFFDVEVTDAEKNRTGLVNDLSGGEKVICSEAISLAISLYNSQVGDVKWDTLYRDECSGALSPKNALLYIKMLRRAIELGNFKRCFFIAHQPELIELADSRIVISNGRISIE